MYGISSLGMPKYNYRKETAEISRVMFFFSRDDTHYH